MRIIEYYLKKIHIRPSDKVVWSEIVKIISDYLCIPEKFFKITYKKGEITVFSQESIIKNELFLNKEKIFKRINETLGEKITERIIFK